MKLKLATTIGTPKASKPASNYMYKSDIAKAISNKLKEIKRENAKPTASHTQLSLFKYIV